MTHNQPDKGEMLKQVRESKGVTLEAVHEATKIPMDALRAIEEGYTIRTLSPFYHKGFLKMYAQYLGVSIGDVIEDHKYEELPKPIKMRPAEEDVEEIFQNFFSSEKKQLAAKILGIALALFLFWQVIGFVKNFFTNQAKRAKVAAVEKAKKKKLKRIEEKKKKIARTQAVTTAASDEMKTKKAAVKKKPVAANIVSLTVRAKKNSWLQVKSDGNIVFQSTLKQGVSETWTADKQIELSGKNINELEFELNGKLIGSLGKSERRARKLTATKDGLVVKK